MFFFNGYHILLNQFQVNFTGVSWLGYYNLWSDANETLFSFSQSLTAVEVKFPQEN